VEYSLTANDREKYATYTRDSATGLDYAMNRYYASQWGRYLSPDPSSKSIAPGNPQSWNRYPYVDGDPSNHTDPSGLLLSAEDCIINPDLCLAADGSQQGNDGLWGSGDDGDGGGGGCPDPNGANNLEPTPEGPEPGPDPCAPPPSWEMFVVATADCYTPFFGKPGVWVRNVTYVADMVTADGVTTQLTGDGSTIIQESLSYISGQKPPASQSQPGSPFFDQISVGNGGNFSLTQTFTVFYEGTAYLAQIQGFTGSVTSSNAIIAHAGYVDVNKNPNLGSGGSHPSCNP
jgi:RHS repeat-associated protein